MKRSFLYSVAGVALSLLALLWSYDSRGSDLRCSPSIKVDHAALFVQVESLRQQGKPNDAWAMWTANGVAFGNLAGAINAGCLAPPKPPVIIGYTIGKVYPPPYASSIQTSIAPGTVVAYSIIIPEYVPGSNPPRKTKGIRTSFGSIPTDQIPLRGNLNVTAGAGISSAPVSVGAGTSNIDLGGAVQPGTIIYGNMTVDQSSNTVFSAYAYSE